MYLNYLKAVYSTVPVPVLVDSAHVSIEAEGFTSDREKVNVMICFFPSSRPLFPPSIVASIANPLVKMVVYIFNFIGFAVLPNSVSENTITSLPTAVAVAVIVCSTVVGVIVNVVGSGDAALSSVGVAPSVNSNAVG